MKSIKINQDWFYHQANIDNFEDILVSGAIKPPLQLTSLKKQLKNLDTTKANGPFYTSLAKKTNLIYDSSYNRFIRDDYAFIIEDTSAIKTHRLESGTLYLSIGLLRMIPFPIRFSNWKDEYQTRKPIFLDKVIGIKIPKKNGYHYIGKIEAIDFFLQTMETTNTYFPFIDIEKEIQIDPSEAYEYMKNR